MTFTKKRTDARQSDARACRNGNEVWVLTVGKSEPV